MHSEGFEIDSPFILPHVTRREDNNMNTREWTGIILAGGLSSRMGPTKPCWN